MKSAIRMTINTTELKRRFTISGHYAIESDDSRIWKIVNVDSFNQLAVLEPMDELEYRKAD